MEKTGFNYDLTIMVKFTKEEFDLLWEAFELGCEQKRYLKHGEFMFGNKNRFEFGDDLLFTDRQIDHACKAIELASFGRKEDFYELYEKMFNLHKMMVKEFFRITENTQLQELVKFVQNNCTDTYGHLQIITDPSDQEIKDYYSQTPNGVVENFLTNENG